MSLSPRVVFFGRELDLTSDVSLGRYAEFCRWLQFELKVTRPTVIFLDLPSRWRELKIRQACRGSTFLLVRIEPKTVNPRQYLPTLQHRFSSIVGGHGVSDHELRWKTGYTLPSKGRPSLDLEDQPWEIVTVASRKFSLVSEEAYSARDRVVLQLAKAGFTVLVIGDGWARPNIKPVLAALLRTPFSFISVASSARKIWDWFFKPPRHSNLRFTGHIPNEAPFVASSKCTLVIENELSYQSEKLVEAAASARKLIYLGSTIGLKAHESDRFMAYNNEEDLSRAISSGRVGTFLNTETENRGTWVLPRECLEHLEIGRALSRLSEIVLAEIEKN